MDGCLSRDSYVLCNTLVHAYSLCAGACHIQFSYIAVLLLVLVSVFLWLRRLSWFKRIFGVWVCSYRKQKIQYAEM